jgi:hypothetical protein
MRGKKIVNYDWKIDLDNTEIMSLEAAANKKRLRPSFQDCCNSFASDLAYSNC